MIEVILAGLAGWRVASLLSMEMGPWDIFERLRIWTGLPATGEAGELPRGLGGVLACVWCTSVWTTAGAYAVAEWVAIWPVAMLAAAGIAVSIHAHVDR